MEFTRVGALLAPMGALVLASTALTTVSPPAAQAIAPSSAFAIIGTISLPAGADQVVVDANDDTVYVGSWSNSVLFTYPPGATAGYPTTVLPLPGRSASLAVDNDDDTVYVRSGSGVRIWATPAGSRIDDTILFGSFSNFISLTSLAVDSDDDTIYTSLMYYQNDDSIFVVNGRNTDDSVARQGIGGQTVALGVDQQDDTVWIGGLDTDTLRTMSGSTLQVANVPGTFTDPRDLVVDSISHMAYVSTMAGSQGVLQKVSRTGVVSTWSDPSTTGSFMGLSLNPLGTRAAFKSGNNDDSLWVVDTSTMQAEGPGLTIPSINQTAQAASGLIYVASYGSEPLRVVAEVQGSLSAASAQAGDVLTLTVAPTPAVAAGQPVVVDDSTVGSVSFGGVAVPVTHTGANTFAVTAPSGVAGAVEVVAALDGGGLLSLGQVNFGGGSPAPTAPASAPRDVQAAAGDGLATLSWSLPESTGTYPVSHYLATSSPGGRTCLVASPERTCEVTGLSNGTAYTFTVKALTGAGWSGESSPSNAVVPRASAKPSIVIAGTREGQRIIVTGTATGMAMGGMLNPWLRVAGQTSFTQGSATILVSMDGTFEWSRRSGKRTSVYVATPDGSMRSNVVTIQAR